MSNNYIHKFCHRILVFCLLLLPFATVSQPVISLTPVITGLTAPIEFVNAGDGSNRVFVVQQGGIIRVFNQAFSSLGTFLTVTGISTGGERGLLSMAFHPNYSANGFFYVFYTNGGGNLEIARYRVSSNPDIADAATKTVILTIPHTMASNHNGGKLLFGADGYLYLSTGDGGGAGDQQNNAQNTTVLLGKMLRIAVTNSLTPPFYTLPAGNPFGNEIWALGLRNPFRWSFDRLTQDMWIGDVGQENFEEIDRTPAGTAGGTNYGWRCYEGNAPYNLTGCGPITNYTFPVYDYPTQNPSSAVTGGMVYRGTAYPAIAGYYLAADFYSGTFYKIVSNGMGGWISSLQTGVQIGISSFGETEAGELYVTGLITGTVYRVQGSIVTPVSNVVPPDGMRIYPTLITTGILNIYLTKPWQTMELININGSVLKKQIVGGALGRLDVQVSALPAGIYAVRMVNQNKTAVQQIIIH